MSTGAGAGPRRRGRKRPNGEGGMDPEAAKPKLSNSTDMNLAKTATVAHPGSSVALKVFTNELVLEKTAKNLDAKDLLNLRITCNPWNRSFTPPLRRKHTPISLSPVTNDFNTLQGVGAMDDYTKRMRQSKQGIPFTKYKIQDISAASSRVFKQFFSVCGSQITDLELQDTLPSRENIDRIRQSLFELTPQLEVLKLNLEGEPFRGNSPTDKQADGIAIPQLQKLAIDLSREIQPLHRSLLLDLLRCATELRSFSFSDTTGLKLVILRALRDSALANLVGRLRDVKIHDPKPDQLQILIDLALRKQKPLRLAALDLKLDVGDFDGPDTEAEQALTSFLGAQAPTLRKLKLEVEAHETSVVRIQGMIHLHTLQLSGNVEVLQFGQAPTATFSDNFPALKRFQIHHHRREQPCGEGQQWAHQGVTELSLMKWSLDGNMLRFEQFNSISFPALTRLDVSMRWSDAAEFVPLWTTWPALQSLRIEYTRYPLQYSYSPHVNLNLDTVLTGIPESSLCELRRDLDQQLEFMEFDWVAMLDKTRALHIKYKSGPGISDLKELQEFSFLTKGFPHIMSDISGYFGFAVATTRLQRIAVRYDGSGYQPNAEDMLHMQGRLSAGCRQLMRKALWSCAVFDF